MAPGVQTGIKKYRVKANGYVYSLPAIAGNTLFFGEFTGKMCALDLNSKGTIWNTFSTSGRTTNAAAVLNAKDELDFMLPAMTIRVFMQQV
jgi:eukaryotic-like serine/threonine-protein kinase